MQKTTSILAPIKCYTKRELAVLYDVHPNTLYMWMVRIGIHTRGRIVNPKQVEEFFRHYGRPEWSGVSDRSNFSDQTKVPINAMIL